MAILQKSLGLRIGNSSHCINGVIRRLLETVIHEGEISADDWLPHFSCKAVGDVLRKFMSAYPDHQMTVLCGHTHSSGQAAILPNLSVKTGGADYGSPMIQEILESNINDT